MNALRKRRNLKNWSRRNCERSISLRNVRAGTAITAERETFRLRSHVGEYDEKQNIIMYFFFLIFYQTRFFLQSRYLALGVYESRSIRYLRNSLFRKSATVIVDGPTAVVPVVNRIFRNGNPYRGPYVSHVLQSSLESR